MNLPHSPLSLWLAEYGPYDPNPPLQEDTTVDVAIIGGGFTGMATACALKKEQPSLRVAVLEQEVVGFGASGRNGSFAMTVVGLGFGMMARLKGKQFVKDAHTYMERAVDGMEALIQENQLQCDYIRPGFLRMATTPKYVQRLQHDVQVVQSLGIQGIEWIDQDAARAKVNSEIYLGAVWEPRLGLVNPAKLVREEKRLARQGGPFSVTLDLTPALGFLGDPRAVYSLGCIGHGVSMAHQNALTITDLLLERETENTACPFVNRTVIPWPPEPLRSVAMRSILGYLQIEDWFHERGLRQPLSHPSVGLGDNPSMQEEGLEKW